VHADRYPLDGHPDVPAVLVLARHDEFFVPEWERAAGAAVVGGEPVELDTGHFPMVEDPAELARVLDGLTSALSPAPPRSRRRAGSARARRRR
jgi:pimeloyl-ACP methyl ester carboxylesterase